MEIPKNAEDLISRILQKPHDGEHIAILVKSYVNARVQEGGTGADYTLLPKLIESAMNLARGESGISYEDADLVAHYYIYALEETTVEEARRLEIEAIKNDFFGYLCLLKETWKKAEEGHKTSQK